MPSPNPDYPQEIKVVTGENTISISSKNLFNGANVTSYHTSNATFSLIDTGIRVTNTATNTGTNFVTLPILNVSNYVGQKFTLRTTWTKTGGADGQVILGLCDASGGNRVAGVYGYTSGEAVTYTIPTLSSATYLACWFYANTTGSVTAGDYVDYTNVQIELGDTATQYVPYKSNSFEINLGENLLPNQIATQLTNGVNIIRNADGSLTLNSSNSSGGRFYFSNEITLEAGSYTFSTKELCNATAYISFQENNTEIWSMNLKNLRTKKLELESRTTFRPSLYCSNSQSYNNYTLTPMLVKGETEKPYKPYMEPIELCKINNYQDYFYKDGSSWYISKIIDKIILTGGSSESWGLYSAVGSQPRRFGLNDTTRFYANSIPIISDHFVGSETPDSTTPDLTIWTQLNYLGITDKNSKWADTSALKTWLASNNVTCYYKLKTPQSILITDADLIRQLDTLYYDGQSYYDKTNIVTRGQDIAPIITAEALQKII